MTASTPHRSVVIYACCCLIVLAALGVVRMQPSPYAARVHVRWADDVTRDQRTRLEREFALRAGTRSDGSTWAYDLGDPAPERVKALIAHRAVADTHFIDRATGAVTDDAERGMTLVDTNPLIRGRDSAALEWIALFAGSSIVLSVVWLVLNRRLRAASGGAAPGAE